MTLSNQPLPSKEAALFKQLVKLYEDKQCKKAVKIADQILKKFPEHGETLAMKGLTMSTMGADKKEEAYTLVRAGLKADLKSHVCWHVYGLLYRTCDKDYKEAAKCYQCALRLDPDNVQILRDLATLQIQMRDLAGFAESRQRLLALKPSNRSNWITFALAQHANKAHDVAIQVLQSYESTLHEVPASEAYEHSELLLYKALLLDEAGQLQEALAVLDTQQDKLKDKLGMLEHRASLLLRLGKLIEAEAQYRGLLALNPDHYRWHEGLQACLGFRDPASLAAPGTAPTTAGGPSKGANRLSLASHPLTDEQRSGLQKVYEELSAQYPRSSACQRIPLDFLQGAAFEAAADAYVRKYLIKGIPSLFMDLCPLYSDPAKAEALGKLFESYNTSLRATAAFPSSSSNSNGHGQPESPQTRVWVLYYLAQHYDHLGNHTHGLQLLEEAGQHTPTLIELYTTKAKLLRHAGDMDGAAEAAEVARRGDLSDRYLNSMAVKALLRANKVNAAEKTAALFTRDGDAAGAGITALYDMQHMWFETKAGAAHMRLGEHGKALKKLTTVLKHFEDIHEDQFDFHGYCVRKTTLRAYVAMLRWEDCLYANSFYLKAAAGAINTYLALAGKPTAAQQEAAEEALLASMSAEERKKYKQAKRKEEKKAEAARAAEAAAREAAAKEAAAAKEHAGGDKNKKKAGQAAADKKDDDPNGDKLAACEDPLGEASKLVVSLKAHAPGVLETHVLAAQVYCRRGKLLLALAAVQQAVRLGGASHPQVHQVLLTFCLAAKAPRSGDAPALHPIVSTLLSEGAAALLQGAPNIASYNTQWVTAHGQSSLGHRMAAARCLLQLGQPGAKEQAVKLVLGAHTTPGKAAGRHAECVEAAQLLASSPIADMAAAEQWRSACQAAFPYSRCFSGVSVVPLDQGFDFDHVTEAFGRLSF